MIESLKFETQSFFAPDGTEMVIVRRKDWDAVCSLADTAVAKLEEKAMNIPDDVKQYLKQGRNPVAAWRLHIGLTQAELADKVGLTQAAIARIESGPTGTGRDDTLTRIAKALGAPLAHINPPTETQAERIRKAVANSADAKTERLLQRANSRR
ncbi:MAG: helix-turn-helix transcriptional regulator [Methylocystaceae bacterium]|uniref:Transcriptional regulator, contains XRE-family HTH domain n=1 Tax=Salipiger thiooxidans TaxID=282683 RepID=A0A1G7HR85_9RHOB|nr:helix-turn-helix transcriptional regulator [Salipiger thiooxidans]NVK20799.1 helix-turn-helix transcriptional regulator [Methylocystaceae bacterium]SDF02843.1 Transcriptional regulator, contains XRE-family HTH domain [Salipiger thiooxidans]